MSVLNSPEHTWAGHDAFNLSGDLYRNPNISRQHELSTSRVVLVVVLIHQNTSPYT